MKKKEKKKIKKNVLDAEKGRKAKETYRKQNPNACWRNTEKESIF
jgi:hypothetical protein